MTAIDQVGSVLSTPVRTPVKEQPIARAYRETPTPSGSSPVQNGEAGEGPMMSQPDDYGNEPEPPAMEQQPLPEQHDANIGADDDVALPESGGLDIVQSQQSRASRSSGDAQEEHVASGRTSWGLTLGQRSFCSDSSAASVASASSIATHLHANWKQSQSQSQKEPAPTTESAAAPRSSTSNAASSPTPTRSTSSSIAAEAGNMTTVGDAAAAAERQEARQPRRRPRQLPSQNAPLFVKKRSPKHRKVEVKPLPNIGASKLLKREERKWDDSRYKFGASGVGGGSLSSKDRSQTASNKAPSVSKSDSSKSSSRRKRKVAMPLASISVPSDANAKKQRKST